MPEPGPALLPGTDGLRVRVRLTPGAPAEAIGAEETLADGRAVIPARVRARPEKGAANAALERLLAAAVGIAKGRASVVAGHKDRVKTVLLAGEGHELARRLKERLKGVAR